MPDFLQSVPGDVWWQVFGRAHPVVLHLPFGVLASLVLLEVWGVLRRRPLEFQTRALLVGLAMVSALVAAGSGWFLGEDPDYGGDRLVTHRNLGIGMAAVSVLMAMAAWRDMRQLYGVSLGITIILLLAAGHHGGSMTHGDGFLFEPLVESREADGHGGAGDAAGGEPIRIESTVPDGGGTLGADPTASAALAPTTGAPAQAAVADALPNAMPILVQRCGKCHGDVRRKGGLSLHDRTAVLTGGDSGPAVVPGDVDASLLMQRLRLPLEHDDHMPPSSKPQLTPEEMELVAAWIAAGLPTEAAEESPGVGAEEGPAESPGGGAVDGSVLGSVHGSAVGQPGGSAPAPPSAEAASTLSAAVARLQAEQVHVESADPESGLLLVDFGARPDTSAADIVRLVDDLGGAVGELSLGGTAAGDDAVELLSGLPSLEKLDLSDTGSSSAGLWALESNDQLRVLDLTGTAADDAAVDPLLAMPALEQVYVWDTAITPDGVARLRQERPGLEVVDGQGLLAEPLETEPEPVMIPVAVDPMDAAPRLGGGRHTYEWVADWLQLPDGQEELGNTHGEIVIDGSGRVYLNTDTEQAVMVFSPDGGFLHSWGAEFATGLHGMQLVIEGDGEFLYFVHFGRHEVVKATLDGTIVWRMGYPEASGKYEDASQFRPTSIAVAPDGGFFVADGYGEHWVHQYDADRNWVRSLGGPGSDPGQFNTPHGVWVDTRGTDPELIVADRENHRLQRFDMQGQLLGVVDGMLRRPCKVQQRGEYLVIPDLAGRVTILDGDNELVTQLGDNPDVAKRANNGVPPDEWLDGEFLAPHSAAWDADGNLYVMDWNRHGRITKLRRVP